jgi:hypothetical protein
VLCVVLAFKKISGPEKCEKRYAIGTKIAYIIN